MCKKVVLIALHCILFKPSSKSEIVILILLPHNFKSPNPIINCCIQTSKIHHPLWSVSSIMSYYRLFLLWICSASLPSALTRQHLVLNLISTHLTPHKLSDASSGTENQRSLWSFNLNWKLVVMCLPVANQMTWKIHFYWVLKKAGWKVFLVLHTPAKFELVNFLI